MERDTVRDALQQRLWQHGVSLAEASLAIGRNKVQRDDQLETQVVDDCRKVRIFAEVRCGT